MKAGSCSFPSNKRIFLFCVPAIVFLTLNAYLQTPQWLYNQRSINKLSLYDQTIEMSKNVQRSWFVEKENNTEHTTAAELAPAQILLTTYGWNQKNQAKGIKEPRGVYARELLQGVIDHAWFHPTAWENPNEWQYNLRYYVFLDIDTCLEYNYPLYGAGFMKNSDVAMGRKTNILRNLPCRHLRFCEPIQTALSSPLFAQGYNATLVVPECYGWGIDPLYRKDYVNDSRLSLVSISSTPSKLQMQVDQGLVPPSSNTLNLTVAQRLAIQQCDDSERDILLSFVGSFRNMPLRLGLRQFHNNKDVLVVNQTQLSEYNLTYADSLTRARFVACPRGEGLFSYRFTEVMSAGAIPVVLANDWVLPFRPELVDWPTECAVIIREENVSSVMNVLNSFTPKDVCSRRQRCFDIYERYMRSGKHIIAGIIEGLERRMIARY